jgi:glycerate dehydrogenase
MMKNDVVIVNEARGAVVNEKDVAAAIKKGMIGAFGSDVYSTEPFNADHPFYEIKDNYNVLFTPHAAWGAYESRLRCIGIICENISAYLAGERKNRVD